MEHAEEVSSFGLIKSIYIAPLCNTGLLG